MARLLCSHCHYPPSSCVCPFVTKVNNRIKLWVLQHPHEQKQAKSTTPLLQLGLTNMQLCVGEHPEDFSEVRAIADKACALLYPTDTAEPVEQCTAPIEHIIVLDGTWSKVHRLWQQNPWLHKLKALSFAQVPANRYHIRKANREQSLSTLEASAYCLAQLEGLDTHPLLHLLDGFVTMQTKQMPAAVKQRYQK
ncbi:MULTISPECIES: tRNA-uridine aminocarboxypropyltransferase [unclassified Pseudoalteromonas]|uniref:tRNA-uridine aminocarboxypropyltransferase n=1 Tax=unclassified Pseudoalteromonas TaxID=194690 RepID=UPI000CF6F840|nr:MULTISPECIES: tRNA-uridine aminocarboxypropyltransferase [unclassified Pseudoalteromonas]